MRMYLISDNIDPYTGMRLSGVEGVVVHEREELEEALSFVTGQPDIGIVLLTEKLGRDFPELVNDLKLSRRTPLFVEIPWKRQKQEFYYGLCQSGNRAETVNGGWMHGDQ